MVVVVVVPLEVQERRWPIQPLAPPLEGPHHLLHNLSVGNSGFDNGVREGLNEGPHHPCLVI